MSKRIKPDDGKKTIHLWLQGYAATGERGEARRIGIYRAKDLDDAVRQYMMEHPNTVHWDSFGRGIHGIWNCKIFDNEEEARKAFG